MVPEHHEQARPIRVLYFIGSLGTGGSELHLARLLLELDRSRVEPALMVVVARGERLADIENAGIPLYDINLRGGVRGTLEAIPKIREILSDWKPDVLHAYGYNCQLYATLAKPLGSPVRLVGARRGNELKRSHHHMYRLTNRRMDWVLSVSEATQEFSRRTEALSPQHSSVIPNGLDLTRFPAKQDPGTSLQRLGTLGRLRPEKGSDLLLEAFASLRRTHPDLCLQMGGPADRAWGRNLISTHEEAGGVEFLGDVDATQFLPGLDLFVLPSRSEGMSNALLEAMACQLPIVATDVGGNREVLRGGECGLIVEPNAESIRDGLESLLSDPSLAAKLAKAARAHVETEYALSTMVERYHRFYEQLLADTR